MTKNEKQEIAEVKAEAKRAERRAKRAEHAATTGNPVVANNRKKEREINSDIHKSKNVVEYVAPAVKATASGKKSKKRNGPLEYEAELLAKPWDMAGLPSRVCFNNAASTKWSPAKTSYLTVAQTVAGNTTAQIVVFPGHLAPPPGLNATGIIATSMDPVSFHCKSAVLATGALAVPVGPFRMVDPALGLTKNACIGFRTDGLVVGGCTNGTSNANPLYHSEQLPYAPLDAAQLHTASHLRWRLVNCGIKVINMTSGGTRGGSVSTVNFTNGSGLVNTLGGGATNQSELIHNDSFRVHEIDDERQSVVHVWTPRTQDLAYWHSFPLTNPNKSDMLQSDFSNAAFAVFLNAPVNLQEYTIEIVANWMLSGTNLASVSSVAPNEPGLNGPVTQVVTTLQSSASSATLAPVVAQAVPDNPLRESMGERLARGGFEKISELAHSASKGVVDLMVNRFVKSMELNQMGPRAAKYL